MCSDDHPQNILTSMQTIMMLILDESEDIQENLITTILSALGHKRNVSLFYLIFPFVSDM